MNSVNSAIKITTGAKYLINKCCQCNEHKHFFASNSYEYRKKNDGNGNDNYGGAANGAADSLTSGGLWDKTAYASATTFTLAGEKYEVKVHFRNTSGDGGLSEDTVKMVSP